MAGYYDALTVLLFMFEFSCLTISDQQNANIQLCSSDHRSYSPVYAKCNATADEVPVPLPHNCPKFKLDASCTSALNYKIPLESASITITLGNHTWDCDQQDQVRNNTFSESSSQLLRIEMIQVEKIYAIYINKTYNISSIEVLKSIENNNSTRLKYLGRKSVSIGSENGEDFNTFYLYEIKDLSDESIGFDADMIEIKFALGSYSVNACEFQKKIKIFSYPGRLCGTPGSYENQDFEPKLEFYLPGQRVLYRCSNTNSIISIDPDWRQCQENGTWSGRAPICIPGSSHYPDHYYAIEKSVKSSASKCYDTYKEKKYNKAGYGATTELKMFGCVVFDFKKNYETEKVEITFRFGDKKGVVVYYVNGSHPIPLVAMKNYTTNYTSSPSRRTNCYASNDGNNQTIFQPFNTRQIIVLGSNISGDDHIFNVILHKFPDKENPRCQSVDSILKAKWNADPTNSAVNIGYWSCDRGYYDQTNSNSVSTNFSCKEGILIGTPPNCKKTYCHSSEIITQNVLINITKRYTNISVNVNSTLIYRCPEGWFLSGTSNDSSIAITCQENGQWSTSENIICENKTHQNNPEIYSIVGIVICGIIGITLLLTAFACCFRKRQTAADSNEKNTTGPEQNLEENEFVTYVNTSDRPPIESHGKDSLTDEEPIIYANVEKEEVVYCEVSFNPDGLKRTKSLSQPDENETIYATIGEPDGFRGSMS